MITRILQLKDCLGLSTRAFAIKCGINQPSLDRMIKGVNALNLKCISSILDAFPEVSAEWLLRGTGDMFNSKEEKESERIEMLLDTIVTLQQTINEKSKTIKELQSQLNS